MLLYVHRNHRFIRDGSPGRPPRLSHSSWALTVFWPGPGLKDTTLLFWILAEVDRILTSASTCNLSTKRSRFLATDTVSCSLPVYPEIKEPFFPTDTMCCLVSIQPRLKPGLCHRHIVVVSLVQQKGPPFAFFAVPFCSLLYGFTDRLYNVSNNEQHGRWCEAIVMPKPCKTCKLSNWVFAQSEHSPVQNLTEQTWSDKAYIDLYKTRANRVNMISSSQSGIHHGNILCIWTENYYYTFNACY